MAGAAPVELTGIAQDDLHTQRLLDIDLEVIEP